MLNSVEIKTINIGAKIETSKLMPLYDNDVELDAFR